MLKKAGSLFRELAHIQVLGVASCRSSILPLVQKLIKMGYYEQWQLDKFGFIMGQEKDTGEEFENGEIEKQRKEDLEENQREWEFNNL